jgi:hypothetical protein
MATLASKWVSYHVRLSLNKFNLNVWITRQNIINMANMKTKLGTTTAKMMNCIHHTFRICLKIILEMPRCSITFIASNNAMDSPSNIEQLPSNQVVPANTNRPKWSRKHHPILIKNKKQIDSINLYFNIQITLLLFKKIELLLKNK